jgi:predicted transcriptional regulator
MKRPPLGDQELEILRYVAEHAPVSVGEVAASFGESRGLARTTILTVMERLRQKGYLARIKEGGLFRYRPQSEPADVMREVVHDFVENRLAGSLTPFVAYLAEAQNLTDEELAALRKIVDALPNRKVESR